MRVSILSMTVGQGHNAASKALKAYLEPRGHEVEILDTYKYINPAIGLGMDKGYVFLGRFWPKLNETIYSGAEKYNGRADMKSYFPWAFAEMSKSKMRRYFEQAKPDIVVCPIVMTAILMTILRDDELIDPSIGTVGIVTDYTLHPFWEYTEMDAFVCPNSLMVPSMVRRGIPAEKIRPTGIPIDPKFEHRMTKEAAREKNGLLQDKFTVMMSAGGMGFSGLLEAATEIDKVDNIQMIAICGTNKMLLHKLKNMKFRNPMHACGFVDNMDEYMDASDIIVTKPGGLSTSEAIAKRKPLLLTNPMPGVENMNHAFLTNNSLAVFANQYQPFSEVLLQLRANPDKIEEMQRAQERWGTPDSARSLGQYMENMVASGSNVVSLEQEKRKHGKLFEGASLQEV